LSFSFVREYHLDSSDIYRTRDITDPIRGVPSTVKVAGLGQGSADRVQTVSQVSDFLHPDGIQAAARRTFDRADLMVRIICVIELIGGRSEAALEANLQEV
jgi:hypothetical protein